MHRSWGLGPAKAGFVLCLFLASFFTDVSWAQGRKVVLVSRVTVDSAVQSRLPPSFSADALRRELEVALESTGLFTVGTRDHHDLDPVIDELLATKRKSKGIQQAELILNPTVEAFNVAERRRRAPNMRGKDGVSVAGVVGLTVQVLRVSDGGVQTRMQIDLPYQTPEHLADPLDPDPLVQRAVVNGPATPEELHAAYQETGRVFAKRVLDQVNPTIVAQQAGDKLYLTRGEDAGYRIGDILRVMRQGDPIVNPVTHEVLDRIDEQIAQAKVVEVRPKVTIAQVMSSTKAIAAGDIVRELAPDAN